MRAFLILAFSLSFAFLAGADVARADHGIDPGTVAAAKSAEQRAALAGRYREHAAEARRDADAYRAMAKAYSNANRPALAAHCQQITVEYQELAAEYEALAESEQPSGH